MTGVLYISNQEVPYRADFFSLLAKEVDLTVAYQYQSPLDRNAQWAASGASAYKKLFLSGPDAIAKNPLAALWKLLRRQYDVVIIGCYNEPLQILAMQMLRLWQRPFVINLDGEAFIGNDFKSRLKSLALKGAAAYLTAGIESAKSLRKVVGSKRPVVPYMFSSTSQNTLLPPPVNRNDEILVVGRYMPYKGLDIAMQVARRNPSIPFTFTGMGGLTDNFMRELSPIPDNVNVIPFMQRDNLDRHYASCRALLLPTRQECWGLVVNEAAAFGTPIVSTYGSGAAVEFLKEDYPQYLATPGDPISLEAALKRCIAETALSDSYSQFLRQKAKQYTIEESVRIHAELLNSLR